MDLADASFESLCFGMQIIGKTLFPLLEKMITIHLHHDDTSSTNGALRVIPGSHLKGKISPADLAVLNKDVAVTCECKARDAPLIPPLILHSSRRSENPTRRRVIHFEYARDVDLDPALD
jgi:ectoine hydroxylase-related dioxygenase (phytanoyl-CoA dioxygenase family)